MNKPDTTPDKTPGPRAPEALSCKPRIVAAHPLGGALAYTFDCAACREKVGLMPHIPAFIPNLPGC